MFLPNWDGTPEGWGAGHYRERPWSRYVLLARARHRRDLERSLTDPDFPYYYDDEAAQKAVDFIELLRHYEGEWFNKKVELADWQEWDIIRPLFGWKRRADGYRRFRFAYIEIPRKNGKSVLAAGIALYLTFADREYGAQVYCAATKEAQARIVWGAARQMLKLSPELKGEAKNFKSSICCEPLGSRLVPLGRDSDSQDGLNVHGGVIDEYHAHKTADMLDVLASGRGSRRQPLLVVITTAGFGTQTPCKLESQRAKKILEQKFENEEVFCFVSTVDTPENWQDEEEWERANPNWGISIYPENFRSEFRELKQSAERHAAFKVKKLNIWSESALKWLKQEHWKRCSGPISRDKLRGMRCFGGLDLGITQDISALALAFHCGTIATPDGVELPIVKLLMHYWIAEEGMRERYQNDGVPYPSWVEAGWITTTPGATTRYDIIRRDLNRLAGEFEIAEIAMDRSHGHQLMVELADDGFNVVKHAQSFAAMNSPCRAFEELIIEGRLSHGDDPVLEWMADNVTVLVNGGGEMRIVKDKSGDRVDGIVAAVMGVGRLLIAPEPFKFVYDEMGVYVS